MLLPEITEAQGDTLLNALYVRISQIRQFLAAAPDDGGPETQLEENDAREELTELTGVAELLGSTILDFTREPSEIEELATHNLRDALAHVGEHGFGDNVDVDSTIENAAWLHLQARTPEDLRHTFHLAGGTLQVVVTNEGIITDAFVGDEHAGTRAELAVQVFEDLTEGLRTCDECGDTEDAGAYPDWVHGRCMDCEMVDVRFLGGTVTRDDEGNITEGTSGVFDPDLLEAGGERDAYVNMDGVTGNLAEQVLANNTARISVNELRLHEYAPFESLEPSGEGTIAYRADVATLEGVPYVDAVYVSAESTDVLDIIFAGLLMEERA